MISTDHCSFIMYNKYIFIYKQNKRLPLRKQTINIFFQIPGNKSFEFSISPNHIIMEDANLGSSADRTREVIRFRVHSLNLRRPHINQDTR